jgi:hypothetical protein
MTGLGLAGSRLTDESYCGGSMMFPGWICRSAAATDPRGLCYVHMSPALPCIIMRDPQRIHCFAQCICSLHMSMTAVCMLLHA